MDLQAHLDAFQANPGRSGFILDFDGTLSSIVTDPEAATLAPGAGAVLASLQARYALVAMLSGRRAEDLAARVGVPGLTYVGLYGGEKFVDDEVRQPEDAAALKAKSAALTVSAQTLLNDQGLKGCRVEQKDMAVSVHFRNSDDPRASALIMAWAGRAAGDHGFIFSMGRKVVELRPAEFSKALALERLSQEHALLHLLVAGDDSSDIEAMEKAAKIAADAVRVGVASEEAPPGFEEHTDIVVNSCEEMVELLKKFAQ